MAWWATILAGGSGTRFWPLSSPSTPKQFLPLTGDQPLLRQAFDRIVDLVPAERVLVVTGRQHVRKTRHLLPEIPDGNVLAEPRAASTGPALAWATVTATQRDADAVVVSMHADWAIGDDPAFRRHAQRALEAARTHDLLFTVGIVPTRPDIGFGYIEPGDELETGIHRVARFREKPLLEEARALIANGALWNSGMFAWSGARFLAETRAVAPEIAPALPALEHGDVDSFFEQVTPIAVDVSHFERSLRVGVVRGEFPWDDIGTWAAVPRLHAKDTGGNVIAGAGSAVETSDSVIWADDGPVIAFGVRDLIVVRANGLVLVTTPDHAPQLKHLLDALPDDLRTLP